MADWYVDGFPLARLMSRFDCEGLIPSGNGFVVTNNPQDLLGRSGKDSELPSGREALYTCSLCGDFGCGVLAVRVTYGETTVRWTDFAWESESEPVLGPSTDYAALPAIEFDLAAYEAVLRQLSR
ncbi:hypothetical protein AB5J62_11890 [Amycolatopsis sp. cg5]|uniref:hypothetical protein n=1 Tax=Amycolatopsis sp. cg5 TaxID=3238802 RepID=UPI003523C7A2